MYEEYYRPAETDAEAVERLKEIIHILRGENGCPWDREQTHESLRRCLIEETYEVIDAIEKKDADNLEEELGDVLLQVVMHSEIGEESGRFSLKTVANRVSDKMIRRHPHVFDEKGAKIEGNQAETIDNVLERWENVKRNEHGARSQTDSMKSIPKSLPALLLSDKVQRKAAEVGFDWDSVDEAFEKVKEETAELLEIYDGCDMDHIKEEVGDLLFAVVNVARFLHIDPEEALHFTADKFIRRFGYIEDTARDQGRVLPDMTLAEMDELWEQAKSKEK
ncbi:nucleoside triphosphate pyrophosphohydrolase [Bacilliculturomica massiliensis]|uniref:nucleoside triphosphate pyrophosphohydrolase n=1 Tax=Bacilliculturomica massiliensis TaxID=1917867 RepID=UPI0010307F4B|nr:nucleoside triphosphate pyrophosphohydrolase [Bacilliculturomica massiliensis]